MKQIWNSATARRAASMLAVFIFLFALLLFIRIPVPHRVSDAWNLGMSLTGALGFTAGWFLLSFRRLKMRVPLAVFVGVTILIIGSAIVTHLGI
jgi:hypothetical protein